LTREPGNRAKVAVASIQSGIDPVGSCVGQKGVRVQAIIQEVGGIEKIDIIQWQDDATAYIAAALSPAKNVEVHLNEEEKIARVVVPQDELSLAIGKDGQNVRLASKLTGYRIEIEGTEPAKVEEPEELVEEKTAAEEPESPVLDVVEAEDKPEAIQDVEQVEVALENENAETPVAASDASAEESVPPTTEIKEESEAAIEEGLPTEAAPVESTPTEDNEATTES